MQIASLAFVAVLFASTAQAQPVCRPVVLPPQNGEFGGFAVTVPPGVSVYPLPLYLTPGNIAGSGAGLEFWAHRVRSGPPAGAVEVFGYLVSFPGQFKLLVMPQANLGVGAGLDGAWKVFPMSTFVPKGWYFTVRIGNTWSKPVTVDLILTIHECLVP